MRASSIVSLSLGIIALLVGLGFIARTDMVIGKRVTGLLQNQAKRYKVDLIVDEMRPVGLTGVELDGVLLRIPRGDRALEVEAKKIRVYPSISSIFELDPRPESVEVIDSRAIWIPWTPPDMERGGGAYADRARVDGEDKGAKAEKPRVDSEKARADKPFFPLEITVINASAISKVSPLVMPKPMKISRLSFVWNGGRSVNGANGYGTFPDGVTFGIHSLMGERSERIRVEANEPTKLHAWFEADSTPEVDVGAISICLNCDDVLKLEDARFRMGWQMLKPVELFTPAALVALYPNEIEVKAADMEFPAGRELGLQPRITETRLRIFPADRLLEFQSKLVDIDGGRLDLQASVGREIRAKFFAQDFVATRVVEAARLPRYILPGVLSGTMEAVWEPVGVLELSTSLSVRDARINIGRLASEELVFPNFSLRFDALIDLEGKSLSLSQGQLNLGPAADVSFGAHLLKAGEGFAFDGFVRGDQVLSASLKDAMPPSINDIAREAILDGSVDFNLRVRGHTEAPDRLILDGDLGGDVKVLRDSPNMDPASLAAEGPPPGVDGLGKFWRSYDQLPAVIPQVLLSAEDASFFDHPGFDWAGLQAAMVHNLEAKSFERGGSTISQQVVKNVFLNHDRTISRKLQEAYLTWRMEELVPKQRILEIYLNIADWGGGAKGIERAAQRYFGVGAADLQVPEMALLASILPSPTRFGAPILDGKIARSRAEKVGRILTNLRFLNQIDMASWARWNREVQAGKFGRKTLEIVED